MKELDTARNAFYMTHVWSGSSVNLILSLFQIGNDCAHEEKNEDD